jgi:hypothetical protein
VAGREFFYRPEREGWPGRVKRLLVVTSDSRVQPFWIRPEKAAVTRN